MMLAWLTGLLCTCTCTVYMYIVMVHIHYSEETHHANGIGTNLLGVNTGTSL